MMYWYYCCFLFGYLHSEMFCLCERYSFLFWTSIRLLLHQTYQYLHLYTMCSKTKLEKIVLSLTIVCFCNGLLFLYDFFLLSIFVACLTLCQTHESYSHSRIVFVLLFRSLTYVIRQQKENNTLWWVKEEIKRWLYLEFSFEGESGSMVFVLLQVLVMTIRCLFADANEQIVIWIFFFQNEYYCSYQQ